MHDKELYEKKLQAQLDEWKAELDKLKAKASAASADARLEMNKHIRTLEGALEEGKTKLTELGKTGEDVWESAKEGVESTWDALKSAFSKAARKFKD